MRVYVVRHGESETNQSKRWTGWLDVHLTAKGKADAQKVSEFLKGISFDKIYTSDLSRAIETAEIAIPNCHYEKTPLLREVNVGSLANQPISVLSDSQRLQASKNGYADFGGEMKDELYKRILQFRKELETQNYETVSVFTHAGWMCGLLDTVVEERLQRKHICCNNCTVAIFEFQNEIWRLHSWINFS